MKNTTKILLSTLAFFLLPLASCEKENTKGSIVINPMIEGGTISLEKTIEEYQYGDKVQVQYTEKPGYHLERISINFETLYAPYTFELLSDTYYIDATFSYEYGDTLIQLSGEHFARVGDQVQIESTVYGPTKHLNYVTSDSEIATVDSNGLITAKKEGFVTIRAYSPLKPDNKVDYNLFVGPEYFMNMIDTYREYPYKTGVVFEAECSLSLYLNKIYSLSIPLTFEVSFDKDAETLNDFLTSCYFHLKFDFNDLEDIKIGSFTNGKEILLTVIENYFSSEESEFDKQSLESADSFDLYTFGDLYLHSVLHSKAKDGTIFVSEYSKKSILELLGNLATSGNVSSEGEGESSALDFEFTDLNSLIDIGADAETGLKSSDVLVSIINLAYEDFLNENFPEDDSTMNAIREMLPVALKDINLTFQEKDNTHQSMSLVINAYKDKDPDEALQNPYELLKVTVKKTGELENLDIQAEKEKVETSYQHKQDAIAFIDQGSTLGTLRNLYSSAYEAANSTIYSKMLKNYYTDYQKLDPEVKSILPTYSSSMPLPLTNIKSATINDVSYSFTTEDGIPTFQMNTNDKLKLETEIIGLTPSSQATLAYNFGYYSYYFDINADQSITLKRKPTLLSSLKIKVSYNNVIDQISTEETEIKITF